MSVNVNELFSSMQEEGDLSQAAMTTLTGIVDLGQVMQAALGTPADQMPSSEVVIATILVDDSYSIEGAGSTGFVRTGVNSVIAALKQSKQAQDILLSIRYLNGTLLFPYTQLDNAVLLDNRNYNPRGGTPLYDESLVMCAGVLLKTKEFADNGVPVRSISLIVTDGMDEHSNKEARHVAPVITDMLMRENHIVAAMGIGDSPSIKQRFTATFQEIGIKPNWILTPSTNESEIRRAFDVFSQSAVRASQNSGANFSQVSAGGFTI